MAGWPIDLWNEWAIQILVLLSFTLQVVLLVFAGIRRRAASPVLRILLWLTYQLADSTAIYALGHLSLSTAPRDHQLVAFWAPFLLLHLGGPDNITAYSLEDSKLWLRHLLTLVVQVLGAAYVLYKHFAGSSTSVLLPAVLMFVVGAVKYGERTWALRCSNMDSIRGSVKKEPRANCHFYLEDKPPHGGFKGKVDEEEFLLRHAHSLFHICKCAIVDSSDDMGPDNPEIKVLEHLTYEQKYAMMEMELSLMYDILYTKAAVIHSLFGYCVVVVSPVATAAAFLLFQFSGRDRDRDRDGHHSRVDVAITYLLLAGAFLLETRSLLNALGSSWTLPFLCGTRWNWLQHAVLCSGRWSQLRRVVLSGHRLAEIMGFGSYLRSARRWSGTMGQYNMLHLCTRPSRRKRSGAAGGHHVRTSPWDTPLPLHGRLANMLGLEEWWDRKHHSGTVQISDDLKQSLFRYVDRLPKQGKVSTLGVVRNKWGKDPLELSKLYDRLKGYLGVEFQEGIIIWHIATDVYLAGRRQAKAAELTEEEALLVEEVRVLSNYMMFLLVERPYMLPGLAQSRLYRRTCQNLVDMWCEDAEENPALRPNRNSAYASLKNLFRLRDDPNSRSSLQAREKLATVLLKNKLDFSPEVPRLSYAADVARILLDNDEDKRHEFGLLRVLLFVWRDFLVYAANRCSRESHAKKLNSGGELTTVLWLLILTEHLDQVSQRNAGDRAR